VNASLIYLISVLLSYVAHHSTLELGSSRCPYGPKLKPDDVVGAGLDLQRKIVFFSVNGEKLKDCPIDVERMSQPCVGFSDAENCGSVTLNFGASKFAFQPSRKSLLPRPWSYVHPHCSWLLSFDSPLILHRTIGGQRRTPGSVVLTEAFHELRPLLPHYPRQMYFEITVLDAGSSCDISLGFSCLSYDTARMPGWGISSVGYNGEDGSLYDESIQPTVGSHVLAGSYGPSWKQGDVIGAGLDLRAGCAFFTVNGVKLPEVSVDAVSMPYACGGFGGSASSERCQLNFGQDPSLPFKFLPTPLSKQEQQLSEDLAKKRAARKSLRVSAEQEYLKTLGPQLAAAAAPAKL
jgi:hypothetical protein